MPTRVELIPCVPARTDLYLTARQAASAQRRLWSSIDTSGDCWQWTSTIRKNGYGVFWLATVMGREVQYKAHRIVWESLVGPIPKGLTIDHLCRHRSCVNPDHLEPVTSAENLRRAPATAPKQKSRWLRCAKGHPFTAENTLVEPRRGGGSSRRCRTCRSAARK